MDRKRHLAIYADEEEQSRLEFIKTQFPAVKTDSSALRAAIFHTSEAKGFSMQTNVLMRTSGNPTTEAKER